MSAYYSTKKLSMDQFTKKKKKRTFKKEFGNKERGYKVEFRGSTKMLNKLKEILDEFEDGENNHESLVNNC